MNTTELQEEQRKRIRELSRQRETLQAQLADSDRALHEQIVEGYKIGIPKLTLSRDAGVSRQTVYSVLLRVGIKD